jgi:hypothetical protein
MAVNSPRLAVVLPQGAVPRLREQSIRKHLTQPPASGRSLASRPTSSTPPGLVSSLRDRWRRILSEGHTSGSRPTVVSAGGFCLAISGGLPLLVVGPSGDGPPTADTDGSRRDLTRGRSCRRAEPVAACEPRSAAGAGRSGHPRCSDAGDPSGRRCPRRGTGRSRSRHSDREHRTRQASKALVRAFAARRLAVEAPIAVSDMSERVSPRRRATTGRHRGPRAAGGRARWLLTTE